MISEHESVVPEASTSYLDYYHKKSTGDSSAHDSHGSIGRPQMKLLPAPPPVEEDRMANGHRQQVDKGKIELSTAPYRRATSLELEDVFAKAASASATAGHMARPQPKCSERVVPGMDASNGGGKMDSSGFSTRSSSRRLRRETSRSGIELNESIVKRAANEPRHRRSMSGDASMDESSGHTFATSSEAFRPREAVTRATTIDTEKNALTDASSPVAHSRSLSSAQNASLTAMEEGRLADDDRRIVNGIGWRSDAYDDEMAEGIPHSSRPMVFRRFYNRLKEERAKPFTVDLRKAETSANSDDEEEWVDGSKDMLEPIKLNYGNFLFGRASGSREIEVRNSAKHQLGPATNAPTLQSTKPSPPKAGFLTKPVSSSKSTPERTSILGGDGKAEDSRPRHQSNSYSTYLRH